MPKYFEISFSLTSKCNAKCEHCCVDASPSRTELIKKNQLLKLIDEASRYGIKYIAFTGGEVSLCNDHLFYALKQCKRNGIKSIVVTNAHWADNITLAEKYLCILESLDVIEIQYSTDMFHLPHIKFDNVCNAINATKCTSIKPVVMLTRVKNDTITMELKNMLLKLGIEIVEQQVVPFSGRSMGIDKEVLYSYNIDDMRQIGCISVLSPTICPESNLYACCASDFGQLKNSNLHFSDLNNESLCSTLKRYENDPIIDSLYLWGPKYLYELIIKKEKNLLKNFKKIYYGYCDLCYSIMRDKSIIECLSEIFEDDQLRKRIRIGKLVKYEKIKKLSQRSNPWYEVVVERENA